MSPVAKIWWRRWVPACVFLACWFFGVWGRCAEVRLLTLTNFQEFTRTTTTPPAESVVLTSPVLDPGFPWKELIVSWNASTNVALSVEARPVPPFDSPFYSLGRWAAKPSPESPRESINGQRDARAEVKTDVLVLNQPARQAQVRLEMRGPEAGLKRVSLAFSGTEPGPTNEPLRNAWGRELAVPVRTQAEFPEGVDKWCSPTSTAMLLAYWGEKQGRPDWIVSVPDIAAAVFDPGWGGTGNWPFNMAFAGSLPGLNAAVARFGSFTDLERWVASGLPAAASVSYALLKGANKPTPNDGHIVVVRGFTVEGDVIVNDPGVRRERVRRIFPRADFEHAWASSRRTVYCVWPSGHALPDGDAFPRD